MTDARVFFALAALLALTLLYIERGVSSAFAPFCAVGTAALTVSAFGCFGLLPLGAIAVYLAALSAAAWLCFRCIVRKRTSFPPAPGFWFFAAASLCFILLLWAKQPMFTDWDEFSFWGTAAKLMKLNNTLYTTAPVGWAWNATSPPVLPALSYFFQFFAPGFAEWQTYAAYDVFLAACMASVLAPFCRPATVPAIPNKPVFRAFFKHGLWAAAFPAALISLLTPFVFRHYFPAAAVSPAYLDSLADIPLGFAFAAALCCGLSACKKPAAFSPPALIAIATLTLTKDIGISLALVVAAVMFLDTLFVRRAPGKPFAAALGGAFARFGIACAGAGAAFGGWSLYMRLALSVDRLSSAGGKLEAGLLEYPGLYLRDLLARPKSDFFVKVNTGMLREFFFSKISMLGSGAVIAAVCIALLALAAILSQSRTHRRRCIIFCISSILGFACYHLLVTMSYLYVLRTGQALAFESYNRYVFPYYIGWLLSGVLLLGQSAAGRARDAAHNEGAPFLPLRRTFACGVLLVFVAALFFRAAAMLPPAFTVFGLSPAHYSQRREFAKATGIITAHLAPEDRVFYFNSGDNGLGWFMLSCQMLPWQLDYSIGGGDLMWRETVGGERTEWQATAGELSKYLAESGCTVLYVAGANDTYRQLYGSLFSDGMDAYFSDNINMYRVIPDPGGESAHLEPWASTAQWTQAAE